MIRSDRPVPGYWYTNGVGHLIQVRAILLLSGRRSRIVLEYINGKREYVAMGDWAGLDLLLHSPGQEHRHQARDI
jgi:hypothetical protein